MTSTTASARSARVGDGERFGIVGGVAVLAVLAVVGVVVALRRYTLTEAEDDEATSAATTGPG